MSYFLGKKKIKKKYFFDLYTLLILIKKKINKKNKQLKQNKYQ